MNTEHLAILKSGVDAWNKWRQENPGIVPDLRYADLSYANLSHANLSHADLCHAGLRHADLSLADLSYANLRYADLSHANLDYSVWPLWCGSKDVTVDIRLVRQLCAHICVLKNDSREFRAIRKALLPYAKKSHRAADLGLAEKEK